MSSVSTKHWSAEKLWFSVKKALIGAENIIIKRTCVSAECRENMSQCRTWASVEKDVRMPKKLSHAEKLWATVEKSMSFE